MANIKSAKKRARQNVVRRKHNTSLKSIYRTCLKKVVGAIVGKKKDTASQLLRETAAMLDKMVGKKIIHKNKAARHKSRLNAKIKKLT